MWNWSRSVQLVWFISPPGFFRTGQVG